MDDANLIAVTAAIAIGTSFGIVPLYLVAWWRGWMQ